MNDENSGMLSCIISLIAYWFNNLSEIDWIKWPISLFLLLSYHSSIKACFDCASHRLQYIPHYSYHILIRSFPFFFPFLLLLLPSPFSFPSYLQQIFFSVLADALVAAIESPNSPTLVVDFATLTGTTHHFPCLSHVFYYRNEMEWISFSSVMSSDKLLRCIPLSSSSFNIDFKPYIATSHRYCNTLTSMKFSTSKRWDLGCLKIAVLVFLSWFVFFRAVWSVTLTSYSIAVTAYNNTKSLLWWHCFIKLYRIRCCPSSVRKWHASNILQQNGRSSGDMLY